MVTDLPGQLGFDGTTQEQRVYENAVERVRIAREAAKGEPLYVAFSGGKDSTVLWAVVCEAAALDGIPIEQYAVRHYHVTGIDPPELQIHMRAHCPDLVRHMPEASMWRLIVRNGPPTRLKRWCCRELKERGGAGCVCLTGVRWAESVRRRETRTPFESARARKSERVLLNDNDEARRYVEHCPLKASLIVNPIVDWTADNVWNYIRDRGLPVCGLYGEGFDRLGCIGCPMAGDGRRAQFERWPKFKELYIRAFDRFVRARREKGLPEVWPSGYEVFLWWMEEKNMDGPMPGQILVDEWEE